ncbi:MAG: mechanosensitive ion channel protein, partial [Bacteroidetes bacterium SW_10_40_5]
IFVSKADDGKWYYSKATVEAIPELHKKAFPFGTDKLIGMVPKTGHEEFLGIAIWQYIGIIILFVLSFCLFKIFYWILNILVFHGIRTIFDTEEASKHVRALSKYISVLIVLFLANLLIPTLQLPVEASYFLFLLIKISAPLAGIVILYSAVDILGDYMKFKAMQTHSVLDDQVVPIVRKTLKAFSIVVGVLFILQNLNFNITALLAGLSIGGLAIALAAQQTLTDFLGSLMIFIDQPFKVGDYIISNECEGIVEAVGFRSTRIRSFERSLIIIPNGKLSDMSIDNMGMRYQRRLYANTAITYDTPPALIETFREGVEKIVLDHPMINNNEYYIRFNEMAGHYLNIMVWAYFDTQVWDEELRYREEVYLQIMRLAESLGVRFAFPTSTIHVEEFPGQGSFGTK